MSLLCALHSSIVPLFSWSTSDAPQYSRQLSAQTAFEHANAISSKLAAITFEYSKLPSFVGYAAYCASAVQIPFLWCLRQDVKEQIQAYLRTNQTIIQAIGAHWKLIGLLVRYLSVLIHD